MCVIKGDKNMIGKINCNTPSFGARIVMTPYFKEGLYTAANYNNDNVSLCQKSDFLNALELIEKDSSTIHFILPEKELFLINLKNFYRLLINLYVYF